MLVHVRKLWNDALDNGLYFGFCVWCYRFYIFHCNVVNHAIVKHNKFTVLQGKGGYPVYEGDSK
jgi:hypothetical protein